MKIFTDDALRNIDALTIEKGTATAMQLIEKVAEGVTYEIMARFKPSRPTIIFAGPAGNGADALCVARMLSDNGFHPVVYLFNIGGSRLTPSCKTARDLLLTAYPDIQLHEIVNQMSLPELSAQWLVVDGLFGSGLRGGLSGGFQALVRRINESGATVVSIDVPSGLHGDWNPDVITRNTIQANLTLAVAMPRIAFFIPDNAPMVGEWQVVDLNFDEGAIQSTPTQYYYVERHDVRPLLVERDPFSSKADYGSALIVGGSYGMAGASVLAARGALRAGAGKVTVYGPRATCQVVQTAVPEAMFVADSAENVVTSIDPLRDYSAVALGPGLGTHESTIEAVETFIKSYKKPLVIDADALNCLARRPSLLPFVPKRSVITPHAGEFDRMFGVQQSAESRLLKATEVARRYEIIVVLKGHYTAVIYPDGNTFFNSSGTPALATPGSGDVLTGVITSFMAQGMRPELAAVAAVYVHGVAGQMAAETNGDYGVTAGDVAACIGRAIAETSK